MALYAVFIARSAVSIGGVTYFSLFDDAMISMRYGQNLADGHGLVWNTGEHPVEGYTNLLWTLVMAAVHRLGVNTARTSLVVMIIGAVILATATVLSGMLARRLLPQARWAPIATMWAVAFYYPLTYWTLRGMEVGLISAILLGAVLLVISLWGQPRWGTLAGLCCLLALGILTRDDVTLPALALAVAAVWRAPREWRVRVLVATGAALGVTVGGHLIFRELYYGALVPNTYTLKLGGIAAATRVDRSLPWLIDLSFGELASLLVLASFLFLLRRRSAPPAAVLLGAMIVLQCAYSVYVGGDAWEFFRYSNRFITSVAPDLIVLAVLGVDAILRAPERSRRRWCIRAGLVMAAVALALSDNRLIGSLPSLIPLPQQSVLVRMLAASWGAVLFFLMASRGAQTSRRIGVLTPAVVGVALVVAPSADAYVQWAQHNADYVANDGECIRLGLSVRNATASDARIAVVTAGAIPYFSERYSIDLLGKSDAEIANSPPHDIPFLPGHVKWDYHHSIDVLRPDIVVQMWGGEWGPVTAAEVTSWGYTLVHPSWDAASMTQVFVRDDTTKVDRTQLPRMPQWQCV